jgi:hypothetical protein
MSLCHSLTGIRQVIPSAVFSRKAASERSPQPALSLPKGRKPWVKTWKQESAPEGRKIG